MSGVTPKLNLVSGNGNLIAVLQILDPGCGDISISKWSSGVVALAAGGKFIYPSMNGQILYFPLSNAQYSDGYVSACQLFVTRPSQQESLVTFDKLLRLVHDGVQSAETWQLRVEKPSAPDGIIGGRPSTAAGTLRRQSGQRSSLGSHGPEGSMDQDVRALSYDAVHMVISQAMYLVNVRIIMFQYLKEALGWCQQSEYDKSEAVCSAVDLLARTRKAGFTIILTEGYGANKRIIPAGHLREAVFTKTVSKCHSVHNIFRV